MPIGTVLLRFRELASAECVSLSTRVTRVNQHLVNTPGEPASGCLPLLASKQRCSKR